MKTYLGIDLGGTNVRVAKVSEEGEVLQELKSPSYAQEGTEKVVTNIIDMIHKIDDYQSCEGIGVGVPGPVDTKNGVMTLATNLPGFEGFPIAKRIKDATNLPTFLDNDANVAGLAEALVGAGKGKDSVYFITQSTGIGGALVVDGKLISGKRGYAGEIGNIVVAEGDKVNALNAGSSETEASGTAIVRFAQERIDKNIESAKEVFDLMQDGHEEAKRIIDEMSSKFALLLADVAHVVDPEIFVLAGGVTLSADLYLDDVKRQFKELVHPGMRDTDIVLGTLDEPGIIGAAMLPISRGL